MFRPLIVIVALAVSTADAQVPSGWRAAGEATLDSVIRHGGRYAGALRNTDPNDFATLRQGFKADSVLGKRIRFSAYVRTDLESGGAALWMRVDGTGLTDVLSFDNMSDRRVTGRTDWTRQEVVLDVPPGATAVTFGLLVSGTGKAWMDDARIEVVPESVRSTNMEAGVAQGHGEHQHEISAEDSARILASRARMPRWPSNLNFERRP